ncbi:MAG: hypothetical protein ACR2JE_17800 [Acidobacteriaceae bacterium]
MAQYRKKPVVVDAIQWLGTVEDVEPLLTLPRTSNRSSNWKVDGQQLLIHTLEGTMTAELGDFIVCGVAGELYPCKPAIFHVTYERITPEE